MNAPDILAFFRDSIGATLLLLGVLIVVHEWGHFIVARLSKVKVHDFAVGFGPILWSRLDKNGIRYSIRAIPAGGFVRMDDVRDADFHSPEQEAHYYETGEVPDGCYQTAPFWSRIAITFAGPLANFIYAFIVLWGLYIYGMQQPSSYVGYVVPESQAQQMHIHPGDRITAINGEATATERDLLLTLLGLIGYSGELEIQVQRGDDSLVLVDDVDELFVGDSELHLTRNFGLVTMAYYVPPVLAQVVEGSPAERAQLQVGDIVTNIDGRDIGEWNELVNYVTSHPEQELVLTYSRDGIEYETAITPQAIETDEGTIGRVGVVVQSPNHPAEQTSVSVSSPFYSAWIDAARETYKLSVLSLSSMWKMVVGLVSVEHLTGPVGIAKITGETVSQGWFAYLYLSVLISISLGIVNLLPLPILDGGRIVQEVIEKIKGSPVSKNTMSFFSTLGIAIIGSILIFTVMQDIQRW